MSGGHGAFWISVILLSYTYLGYPLLLWLWSALRPRVPRSGCIEPSVSVLVVAHNEAAWIQKRLENLLTLDYPKGKVEIILASDGSTDDTVTRAQAYTRAGVTIIAFQLRRGKSAVLNDLISKARGEIVVLADARQRFEPGVLRALVNPFADLEVGAVSGELVLSGCAAGSAVGEGVGFYWRYEKFIRRREALLDSTIGTTGAIYAIRRDLFQSIPGETILDDVLIPMRIVRRGYRVVFEPGARAYDPAAAAASVEFARKVRTIAGNFQLFAREWWLLNPFANRLWVQTVSHKCCRLLCPLGFGVAFVANLFLLGQPTYRWILGAQIVFYAASLGGHLLRDRARKIFFLSIPYTICLLNWATVVACYRFIRGRQSAAWEKAGGEALELARD